MNINSIPNYSLYFRGNKVKDKEELTQSAKLALDEMQTRCKEEVPEKGPFHPPVVHMCDIPSTYNQAIFQIEKPRTAGADKRVLTVGVERKLDKIEGGRDYGTMYFVLGAGTKQEILDELEKLKPEKVAEDIKDLSDRVDKQYSEG